MTNSNPKLKLKRSRITAEAASRPDFQKQHPKYSFEYLDGAYCITKCETEVRAEVITTLHKIAKQTWQELQQISRKCGGFEFLPVDSLKCKIPEYFKNSEKAVVFHNPGKKAIIGFREEENYFIIAIDRNFKAYNHGK